MLSPSSLFKTTSAERLCALGIWSERAARACQLLAAVNGSAPRYFRGRRVLTPAGLGTLLHFDGATQQQHEEEEAWPEVDRGGEEDRKAEDDERVAAGVAEVPVGTQGHGHGQRLRRRPLSPSKRVSIVNIDGQGVCEVNQRQLLDLNQVR